MAYQTATAKPVSGLTLRRRTLTAQEVADALGVGVQTVYDMARADKLPCIRVGVTGSGFRFPIRRLAEVYPDIFLADDAA